MNKYIDKCKEMLREIFIKAYRRDDLPFPKVTSYELSESIGLYIPGNKSEPHKKFDPGIIVIDSMVFNFNDWEQLAFDILLHEQLHCMQEYRKVLSGSKIFSPHGEDFFNDACMLSNVYNLPEPDRAFTSGLGVQNWPNNVRCAADPGYNRVYIDYLMARDEKYHSGCPVVKDLCKRNKIDSVNEAARKLWGVLHDDQKEYLVLLVDNIRNLVGIEIRVL
ncbi:MAG: hypothetical protein GXY77_02510 [Fibrobacter sp.]|nr:hypothetical protein [Fibrobacter sp.]